MRGRRCKFFLDGRLVVLPSDFRGKKKIYLRYWQSPALFGVFAIPPFRGFVQKPLFGFSVEAKYQSLATREVVT
jgi:hypothetical protein